MRRIAVYILAYNEEKTIGSVVALSKKHGTVYVVDDGSEDRTASAARAAGAIVLRRKKNGGYGSALLTALAHAKKLDADAFVFLDADFQHDPGEIPAVAGPVLSGKADVCVGSRFLGATVRAPLGRREGVGLLNRLSGIQAKNRAVDFQCGFRAFSKQAVERIRVRESGYAACPEAVVSALHCGLRVAEAPVTVRYYEGRERGAIAQGAGLAGYVFNEIAKHRPLLFFGVAGTALLLASALAGLFVVDTFYATGALPVGSAFLTVFFGIVGLVLISIGINLYTLNAVVGRRGGGGY